MDVSFKRGSKRWSFKVPNTTYTLTWTGNVLYCSCPAFKYQRLPIHERLCKHIKANFPSYVPLTHSLYPQEKYKAPLLPLFAEYNPQKHNVSGWMWSEKHDGIRCYWDGKVLMTRNGNSVRAPDSFVKMLPPGVALDGELAGPRETFVRTLEALQVGPPCVFWNQLRFYVFDMPTNEDIPFQSRYQRLVGLYQSKPSASWRPLTQHKVRDMEQLERTLKNLTREGGEGIVLRNPDGLYHKGRNVKVGLKWKLVTYSEGELIERSAKDGSYVIREMNESGIGEPKHFILHVSPHDDVNLKDGVKVKFSFRGRTPSGKPRFPAFENVVR